MQTNQIQKNPRFLIGFACVVVIIAGIKAAANFLVPLLAAMFLSLLCIPPMRKLQKFGLSSFWSIVLVVLGATMGVVLFWTLVGTSISDFQLEVEGYQSRLRIVLTTAGTWLDSHGFHIRPEAFAERLLQSGKIMEIVSNIAVQLLTAASNIFLVVLMMIFMLIEANGFSTKLRRALGNENADLQDVSRAASAVYDYVASKTVISLITGVTVTILNLALGVDFPFLWGLVAFLFNFVPNIGSVIAAIPAILIAFLDQGTLIGFISVVGYTAINTMIGSVIEPRVYGHRLGLSPLFVFLSLVFWGWVWGPLGMLMSVPLTVIIKILLEHTEQFKGISLILGPVETQPASKQSE